MKKLLTITAIALLAASPVQSAPKSTLTVDGFQKYIGFLAQMKCGQENLGHTYTYMKRKLDLFLGMYEPADQVKLLKIKSNPTAQGAVRFFAAAMNSSCTAIDQSKTNGYVNYWDAGMRALNAVTEDFKRNGEL